MLKILLPVIFLLISGCLKEMKENEQPEKETDIGIDFIDENKLSELISDRNGKLLFVNVWATWCVPCIREFPDIVRIYKEYGDKIDFLSLSADFAEEKDSVVIPFLKKQNAHFRVFLINEKRSEQIINTLNPEWGGAIPASFVFGSDGKLKLFVSGAREYKFFSNSIDSLLSL